MHSKKTPEVGPTVELTRRRESNRQLETGNDFTLPPLASNDLLYGVRPRRSILNHISQLFGDRMRTEKDNDWQSRHEIYFIAKERRRFEMHDNHRQEDRFRYRLNIV